MIHFQPIVLEDSDDDSDTIIIEDFEDDDCYVTTSSFGPPRDRSHSPLVIDSDDDSDILQYDSPVVDEDIIICDDSPIRPAQPASNRGSSVSPEPTDSPEGVILID